MSYYVHKNSSLGILFNPKHQYAKNKFLSVLNVEEQYKALKSQDELYNSFKEIFAFVEFPENFPDCLVNTEKDDNTDSSEGKKPVVPQIDEKDEQHYVPIDIADMILIYKLIFQLEYREKIAHCTKAAKKALKIAPNETVSLYELFEDDNAPNKSKQIDLTIHRICTMIDGSFFMTYKPPKERMIWISLDSTLAKSMWTLKSPTTDTARRALIEAPVFHSKNNKDSCFVCIDWKLAIVMALDAVEHVHKLLERNENDYI